MAYITRGTMFPVERIDRVDPSTGILVRQVTSFPTPSLHLHYETPSFTPDAERMLVISRRGMSRSAPFDLLTMRSNGDDPMQLSSDGPDGVSCAAMTVDGRYALYMEGGTCHRTHMETACDEEVGSVDGASHYMYDFGMRTPEGRFYFSMVRRGDTLAWVRWDLLTGEHVIVVEADLLNHPMSNPGGREISIGARYLQPDGSYRLDMIELYGDTLEPLGYSIKARYSEGPYGTAHGFWLGRTGNMQSTQLPPGRAIQISRPDEPEVEIVAEGPYFWHSGASLDGEWIVADSNWPDEGMWLINVATRKRDRVCYPGASQGHPQWTHLHANLSDDGRYIVFDSDATGITQVYVVEVPDEMRKRLSTPD